MLLLGVTVCVLAWSVKADSEDLVVRIESGTVSGWERLSRDGRVYQAWTGIPYAESPVGKLRFKAPIPANKWEGVLNATGDLAPCLQLNKLFPTTSSEDCLHLNVYRPKISDRSLPVIVFIHGGGFQVGIFGPRESADYIMDEDVVLVGIHYRLGVLGFMSLGDSVIPGNFGIKDQVMALRWVKQNIAAFGGDPNRVMAVGGSAGAGSSHLLLKSPACDDLIHRAVSDSGSINKFWSLHRPEMVRNVSLGVVERTGCLKQSSQEILHCLQGLDVSTILNSVHQSGDVTSLDYVPVIEPLDAEDPVVTFDLSTRPTNKSWITSTTNGERSLFKSGLVRNHGTDFDSNTYLRNHFSRPMYNLTKARVNEIVEILEKRYFSASTDNVEQASKMHADIYFHYPAIANIRRHEGPKWIYSFEYVGEVSRWTNERLNITDHVASHAAEGDFYLNSRSQYPGLLPKETPEDYAVSKRLIKYLVNFAKYDNPTLNASPSKWDQFRASEMLRITEDGDRMADNETMDELDAIHALWDSILGW